MKKIKKIGSFLCILALTVTCLSITAFATSNNSVPEVEVTEAQDIGIQSLSVNEAETLSAQEFYDIGNLPQTEQLNVELADIPDNALNGRENWAINGPVFVGKGTLSDSYDLYLVTLTDEQLAFLKLESSNPNLMAVLYNVEDGYLGSSTGWGVFANSKEKYAAVPAKQYAILIGSATGKEVGDYKLMWNCSNPFEGAKYVINRTNDLARVVVYYDSSTILSNGQNILTDLTWEEHETWYMPLGYSARDMSMKLIQAKGVYLGSFSSSAPYSAPNALLVDVQLGTWLYKNSYYKNDVGDVTHIMDWFDPSGMKTPRTFGEGPYDFSYGPNYIVINLDTFEVCEFLSPFNYHYTENGGRTFTLTNLQQLN